MNPLSLIPKQAQHIVWPVLAILLLLVINVFDISAILASMGGEETTRPLMSLRFFNITLNDSGQLSGPLISILIHGSKIMVLAIGMTLVIATGGVDLSVGAVFAIAGACVAAGLAQLDPAASSSSTIILIVLGTLLLSLCLGIWNGFLVSVLKVQPIVATFVLMVAGRGIAQILNDGQVVFIEQASFLALGRGYVLGIPMPVWVVASTLLATVVLLRKTALGLFVEAVGDNKSASHFVGIRVGTIEIFVYAYCGLCAGVAGIVYAAFNQSSDPNTSGLYLELDAILAVVIGGTPLMGGRFFILGSICGALLIQTLNSTILFQGFGIQYTLFVKSIVIVLVCLIQSPTFRTSLLSYLPQKENA